MEDFNKFRKYGGKKAFTHRRCLFIAYSFTQHFHTKLIKPNSQQAVDLAYTRNLNEMVRLSISLVFRCGDYDDDDGSGGGVVSRRHTMEQEQHFNYLITLTPCILITALLYTWCVRWYSLRETNDALCIWGVSILFITPTERNEIHSFGSVLVFFFLFFF